MDREQRMDGIRAELSAVETSITTVEAALLTAASVDEIARLGDDLTSLTASRTELQLELNNIEAAGVEVDGPR